MALIQILAATFAISLIAFVDIFILAKAGIVEPGFYWFW
jgi:hypothetical protein